MDPYQRIATALNAEFPRPRVDSEWLEQCCAWIAEEKQLSVTENFQEFFKNVHDQLLKSDLKDSMHHGTGLPEVTSFTGIMIGAPVLVQILAIKEIGVSAFQLEQIRAAREERMLAGVGDEEGEEDGDVEVEGEGPMPKYPRSTLLLRLSDGAAEFEAMEYRPIPQLVLGVTNLGYKLQLNGTRFSNGIAFLEPATIKLIGGENTELDAEWGVNFKEYLQARLAGQMSETHGESRSMPTPHFPRAPLRDISPRLPTLHDDDADMEPPRRKRPSNVSLGEQNLATPTNPRTIKPLPTRIRKSAEMPPNAENTHEGPQGGSTSYIKPIFGRSRPYCDAGVVSVENPNSTAPERNSSGRDKRTSFDFDLLDEVDDRENVPPRAGPDKGKGLAIDPKTRQSPDGNSSDYGIQEENMFADHNFWEALDRVEQEALDDGERSNLNTQFKSGDRGDADSHSQRFSEARPTPPLTSADDVIELDADSDDANKENAFVPMRHVRRRTEDLSRGRSPTTSQNKRPSSQAKKKAIINPCDIIDISDSD